MYFMRREKWAVLLQRYLDICIPKIIKTECSLAKLLQKICAIHSVPQVDKKSVQILLAVIFCLVITSSSSKYDPLQGDVQCVKIISTKSHCTCYLKHLFLLI